MYANNICKNFLSQTIMIFLLQNNIKFSYWKITVSNPQLFLA